jgi:hypothetical protein
MVIPGVSTGKNGGDHKELMRIFKVAILFVWLLILHGCATGRTGTHVEPNFEDISRIEKVGLHVNVERGFAVRLQYITNVDEASFEDLITHGLLEAGQARFLENLAGMVGPDIASGIGVAGNVAGEFSPDKQATRSLIMQAAPLNSAEAIGYVLLHKFQTKKIFPEVELMQSQSPTSAQESGIDTFFIFTVRRWGLRPPLGSKYDVHSQRDKALAQLELDVNLKLISSVTGKILWERDEFHIDDKSYSLGDFKSQEGLLARRMERALQLVCDWTANEIYRTRFNKESIQ